MTYSYAQQFLRAVIVIAVLLLTLPLGAFLGAFTVSAFTENIVTGTFILSGSVTIIAAIGLGLYIVAEGEIPAFLRRRMTA